MRSVTRPITAVLLVLAFAVFFEGTGFCVLAQSRETPVVRAVRETGPAVVNISTMTVVQRRRNPFSSFSGDEFFRRFFDDFFEPRMPQRKTLNSLGSGVIIDGERGYILTNQHVVMKASSIKVILSTEEEFEAKVVGSDPESDLAVLKIDASKKLPSIHMGRSDELMIGETVIAIGNPFGFSHTVTTGVISALNRSIRTENRTYYDFIQTDASINPGNSGGPLLNINGELIGINTAIYSKAEGIGFAIPIDRARRIVDHLIKFGEVHAAWIGLEVQTLTPELARHFSVPLDKGVLVSTVVDKSPAQKAGIKRGDVITSINKEALAGKKDYARIFTSYPAGNTLEIDYYRAGGKHTISLKTLAFPEELAEEWFYERSGIRVSSAAGSYSRDGQKGVGLEINSVRQGSIADQIGLKKGDIIREINEFTINSAEELRKAIVKYRHKGPASFLVQRGRYGYYLTIDL